MSTQFILAIDPGETSGLVVVGFDSEWLEGGGSATWEGIGKAVRWRYAVQLGRDPKAFDFDAGKARKVTDQMSDELHLPVTLQPLEEDDDPTFRFYQILDMEGPAGGGDLRMIDHNELRQVRQIAGLLHWHEKAALVIEGFTLRTQTMDPVALSPDRLRFAIEAEEVLHGRGRLPFIQQPSYAMSTATDDRLKRAGLYYPGMPHATDAMRHAVTFARDLRRDPELRLRAFPNVSVFPIEVLA